MDPLAADRLSGVWCTALLPIEPDESIDWARLGDDLDYLVAARPAGVYVHGTAGEFQTLSGKEFARISAMLSERCEHAEIPFQLGASHSSGQVSLTRIAVARELRPGAIQVVLPDWLPLSPAETVDALRTFAAAAAPVPLVLYNPPHAKTVVSPETYETLSVEVPAVIGIKVAGGDAAWHERMAAAAPSLAVFVAGHELSRQLPFGARGSYSNVACLSPRGAQAWYDVSRSNPPAAEDLHRRTAEFFAEHVRPLNRAGYSAPALDKYLAAVGGWSASGTRVRWPHRSVPADAVAAARAAATALIPELLVG